MKKIALLLCAMLLLCSCSAAESLVSDLVGDNSGSNDYAYEDEAAKLEDERDFYNGYLGISFKMPAGWWIYDVSGDNFTSSASTSSDPGSLDIYKDDSAHYMYLLDFANLQHSTQDNHIGFNFEAEKLLDTASIDDYVEYNAGYMENDEGIFDLLDSSTVTIAGKEFVRQTYEVPQGDTPYNLMVLTCAVNDGYFFTVYVNYWPENTDAEEYSINMLNERLTLA